ncbi:MAG: restriction endonuclease subunit S [Candidatus Thorarchaeota archaeon]
MTSEWKEATLGDVCSLITDGAHFSPSEDPHGKPMASIKDLTRHGIDLQGCKHIPDRDFKMLVQQGCMPQPGDVLIAKDGNSALETVCVHGLTEEVVLLSSIAILRPNEGTNSTFLRYYLEAPSTYALIMSGYRSGSAIPRVVLKDFSLIPVPVPPLPEQRTIAHILGTLDDKIELNRRMNETLEEIVRAIFKSWFVDFDPVRAKAEGRPTGLPEHIDRLFPSSFVDSELGEIPEGWRIVTLTELAKVVDCLHSKKPEKQESGSLLIQLGNVSDNGYLDFDRPFLISDADYTVWTKRMEIVPGDLVITKTGRVGAVGQMPKGYRAAMGRNLVGLRSKKGVCSPRFLRDTLLSTRSEREMVQNTNDGTILKSLHVKAIEKLRVVYPEWPVVSAYENLICDIHDKQELCNDESETLSSLRDTLLPKLISGELRIEDPERFIEKHIESKVTS